jgi:hypothetical protein
VTAPSRLICAPWVTVTDLPDSKPVLDDDTWSELLWQASELLYVWSGRQYSGGCTSTVVLDTPPGAQGPDLCWFRWEVPWSVPELASGYRGVRPTVVAHLPDSPVTSIDAVTIGTTDLVADVDYVAELPAGLVRRLSTVGDLEWPVGTRITYTHGILPPIGGRRAAAMFAVELGKAWSGGKCELPKRVTSVTRQGLSYDLAAASSGWGTGIWEIDSWLLSVNPTHQSRRASAWSPDTMRARRTTS